MQKLIIDFDSTLCDSILAYCSVYSIIYKNAEGFKIADPNKVKLYSLKDECPLVENPLLMFDTKMFFDFLQPFPNAVEVIENLSKQFDIYVVSVCRPKNAYFKNLYLRDHFKGIKQFIPLINFDGTCKMEKGNIINSDFAICIDDGMENLESFSNNSSSNHNIIFGKEYYWNINNPNNYHRCLDWLEVYNYITLLMNGTNGLDNNITH